MSAEERHKTLSPSELARLTGVSTDTLRHYERKGVLGLPTRSDSEYRRYPPDAVARVRLVRRALTIGFTLDELAGVLSERDRGGAPCQRVRTLVTERLAELEARLGDLTELGDELRLLLRDWDRRLAGIPSEPRPVSSICSLTDPSSIVPSRVSVAHLAPRIGAGDPWQAVEVAPPSLRTFIPCQNRRPRAYASSR